MLFQRCFGRIRNHVALKTRRRGRKVQYKHHELPRQYDATIKEVGNEYNTVEIVQYKQKNKQQKDNILFLGVTHCLIISLSLQFY